MPLTVGFDATAAARQSAGIGRYTRELLFALGLRADTTRYRLFFCAGGELRGRLPSLDDRFRARALPISDRVTNAVWHRARLPIPVQAITGRIDLFHSPDFTLPPTWRTPSVVTVHDLAFLTVPECAYPTLRAYLETVVPRSIRRATRIIAVSESTKRDIVARIGVPPERVEVVYEGVSEPFAPGCAGHEDERQLLRAVGIDGPFLLSVGTLEPRKNYPRLLTAYRLLRDRGIDLPLVIAGGEGWLYEPVYAALDALALRPHVRFLTPDDALLVALYGQAAAFVYPSLYEGFGIPPLEALARGAPSAVSNTSSLPEVVGDAALTFDPTEPEAIAGALERLLTDTALADRLRRSGPPRAAAFTWDRAAAETHAVYEQVAGD